jgi:ABC-2 type transport system permease protein
VFLTIARLELASQFRRGTTYLYFAVLFLLAAFGMASDALQSGTGAVSRNAPATIAQIMIGITIVGQVITTAVVGAAILRDFQYKTHELLFTTRVTRVGYLGGRFAGSLIAMVAIYSAVPLGAFVGTLMPWLDHDTLQAFHLSSYTRPFFLLVLPNIVFVSALMFAVGALTRNLFAIYTQGILLLAGYAIAQIVLVSLDQFQLAGMVDPFGDTPFGLLTRYWTISERNTRSFTLSGPLLTNRLIWLGVAVVLVAVTFAFVRLETSPRSIGWRRRRSTPATPPRTPQPALVPTVSLAFGAQARLRQLASQSWFFFVSIVREPVFVTIACIGLVFMSLGAWFADVRYGTALWPVTGQMVQAITRRMYLFLVVLTTIYAGELVWRERQLGVAGTTDALPAPTAITLIGKFIAFLGAMLGVELCAVLATVTVQTLKGYHHYELGLYARGILGIAMPTVLEVAALAFVVHAVVNEKFVGHVIMIVYFLVTLALSNLGFQRVIYQYGFTPDYVYSDMDQFRQYSASLTGLALYFSAVALGLLIIAYLAWPRGADETRRARIAAALARLRSPATRTLGGATAFATVVAGGFVWHNTAVLNRFTSTLDVQQARAAYERDFRRYHSLLGPRIVAIRVRGDLVPERRTMALSSVYTVVNKHAQPIDTLYVSLASTAFHFTLPPGLTAGHDYHVDSLVWNRPTRLLFADSARGVFVYGLAHPMAPGDSMTLAFGAHFAARGYPNDRPNNDIVANGTFINSTLQYFPSLCYEDDIELSSDDERKRAHLPPKAGPPSLSDESARANSLACDADRLTFDAVLSTAPDQIAIAPGALQREWMENGRRFFAYHMDSPIRKAYSIQSGRYVVRHDSAPGVAIDVYYHPGHDVDVGRMIEGTKRGLAYYGTHFSPYQFHQFRIVEFPRYQEFAEAFPGTVPFSEGLGFISRVRDSENDLDWPLFATAHELGHQWWGHQITPANQEGAVLLVESLAEYSALTVMEQKYGVASLRKFLRYELDRYLSGRATERKREVPLMRVGELSQLYIAYYKGSLAFYALRDYIGEDSLNAALSRFLHDKAFQGPPYTNSAELLQYLRAVTPDSLQYVIHDLFETITLYDNRATAATATRRADGRYDVSLTFNARKLRADSLGAEHDIPVADYIDVGVFAGNRPLAVRKVHVTQPTMTVAFVVSERPTKAGVDPFNKLIDRAPEDNVMACSIAH